MVSTVDLDLYEVFGQVAPLHGSAFVSRWGFTHAVFLNAVEGPPFCVLARRALFARRTVAVLQHRVAVATINLRGLQERMVVHSICMPGNVSIT